MNIQSALQSLTTIQFVGFILCETGSFESTMESEQEFVNSILLLLLNSLSNLVKRIN